MFDKGTRIVAGASDGTGMRYTPTMAHQRTIVYIDGFNLYYGCLKDSPFRWIDPCALAENALWDDLDIVGVKYFTAKVRGRENNPGQGQRQQVYFRALRTLPDLSIHYGRFITRTATRRLVGDTRSGKPRFAQVYVTEEKGSDVSLASHLLIDGFRARYDVAVVVSNDSDLEEPVRFVRHELDAPVGVLNPHRNRSWSLSPKELPSGSFYKVLRKGMLEASQFPDELEDEQGTFRKPPEWTGGEQLATDASAARANLVSG